MLVVSDTSPLSNLAIIGRLALLPAQFSEIWMPPAVARELAALEVSSAQAALSEALRSGWLKEIPLPVSAPFPADLRDLDAGETEALRLALATSPNCVLMDEKEGRQRASSLHIRTIGVLGILISAKRAGSISSLRTEIDRLRCDAGFFVDRPLELQVLAMVDE
jgi:predicted nucleic acid-binding protein